MHHIYFGDEHKDLIYNTFKSRLMGGDLYLIEFDHRKLGVTNVIKNYLEKKDNSIEEDDCVISRNLLETCQMLTIEHIGS